jgi:ribosomal protein S18 acetylase RimI-like enzyme
MLLREVRMERIKCEIRKADKDDRGMLVLLAEETLHPLAEYAGHPERYHAGDVVGLLDRADVFVAQCGEETGGFVAVETEDDACAVRCICVNPGFEARGVANQLLDWVEGLAIERKLSRLVALVPAADAPSLHLYRGHGFVTGQEAGDQLALEKRLPEQG